ncbi:MAG: DUF2274 domain-containing protein [Proteobacteria bacterium]|nr:DUF2274 domain-containing protein [Pseudomonadota bacterium]
MKLNKIKQPQASKRISISLPEDEHSNIEKYVEFYKYTYKEEVKENDIIRNILSEFIGSDKKFINWKKANQK